MKISELTPTEVLNDEDLFPVVQNGETKNVKRKDLFKNLPTPTEDGDAATKEYVDNNTLQEKMYTFSFADLGGIKVASTPLLRKNLSRYTIPSKGGVTVNIPAIQLSIHLYTGKVDLLTEEITPLFDLPVKYIINSTTIDRSSITNIADFTPYAILPLVKDDVVSFDYLISLVKDYLTLGNYYIFSNSTTIDDCKLMGFGFALNLEFANETVRDTFYDEFSPVLNEITHFCLKYEKHNMQTIESSYIGG